MVYWCMCILLKYMFGCLCKHISLSAFFSFSRVYALFRFGFGKIRSLSFAWRCFHWNNGDDANNRRYCIHLEIFCNMHRHIHTPTSPYRWMEWKQKNSKSKQEHLAHTKRAEKKTRHTHIFTTYQIWMMVKTFPLCTFISKKNTWIF